MDTDSDTAERQPAEQGVRVTEAHLEQARALLEPLVVGAREPVDMISSMACALAEAEAGEREACKGIVEKHKRGCGSVNAQLACDTIVGLIDARGRS